MRWKSGLGSAAVAAIVLSTLGMTPAVAEEAPPAAVDEAVAESREPRRDPSPCQGVDFETLTAEQSFEVTDPGDGTEEGTLRWAFAQANEHPGTDEIVIAAGLQVRTTGDIELGGGIILRGAGAGSEIVNVTTEQHPIVEIAYRADDFPVLVKDLTLSGSAQAETVPGLDLSDSVCALGLHDVVVKDFTDTAIIVGDTWPFVQLDIRDSLITGNSSEGHGAIVVDNEGVAGAIRVSNSVFTENNTTGLLVTAGLESYPGERGSVVVEGSQFTNNRSADEEYAAGVSLTSLYFEDSEDEEVEEIAPPETPMVTVRDSLFSGNTGGVSGAMNIADSGVFSDRDTSTTLVSVERSTFVDNTATGDAWGWPASDLSLGTISVTDSPGLVALAVSDSTFADPVDPGMPNIRFDELAGLATLQHVTLEGGGISYGEIGNDAALKLSNSVLATEEYEPVQRATSARTADAEAELVLTEGHMAYTMESQVIPAGEGRVVGTTEEFALGDLDDSLGATPVRVPGEGSVLIDAAGSGGAATDQRGASRPQGDAADIGAVEVEVAAPELQPATLTIGPDQTAEAGAALEFAVSRANAAEHPWTGEASVRVRTADGTAHAGADYTAVDSVVTWAADEAGPKTVTIPTDPGHVDEGDVTLTVTLSDPGQQAVLGERVSATGTIVRDVDPGTIVPPKPTPTPEPTPAPTPTPGEPTPGTGPLAVTGQDGAGTALLFAILLAATGGATLLLRRRARG